MKYGTIINGTSGTKLSWQQSIQHRTLNSRNTQRSRHLNLAVAGDPVEPAYEANRAPVLQWARIIARRTFPLASLRLAVQHFQRGLAEKRHMWAHITGPITALIATLKRVKWRLLGAHMMIDHNDLIHDLRHTPTAHLKKLIDEATNISLWKKHAKGTADEASFQEGASSDAIRAMAAKGSCLNGECRATLVSAATGGQWTQDRHYKAAHVDSDLCLLCKAGVGSEWHRVYTCPFFEPKRRDHLEDSLRAAAAPHESAHHDRWTRGHLPNSARPPVPPQPKEIRCSWTRGVEGTFTDEAFLDGSSSCPTQLMYSASACSVVGMSMQLGRPRLELQLNVELTCGHDGPEAAEICALEFLLRHCTLPILAWSDCANVIDAYARGKGYCTSLEHAQSMHWRRVFDKLEDHGPTARDLLTIQKVKAHTTIDNYANHNMTFTQFSGNRHADKGAKDTAIDMSVRLGYAQAVTDLEKTMKDHKGLVRWIAEVTAMANDDASRDADNVPAHKKASSNKVPRTDPRQGETKRKRAVTIRSNAARMFGTTGASDIQVQESTGKYLRICTSDHNYPAGDTGEDGDQPRHSSPTPGGDMDTQFDQFEIINMSDGNDTDDMNDNCSTPGAMQTDEENLAPQAKIRRTNDDGTTPNSDVNLQLGCDSSMGSAPPDLIPDANTHSPVDTQGSWHDASIPDDIFSTMGEDDEEMFVGVSACPAGSTPRIKRCALLSKTTPKDAFDLGYVDAFENQGQVGAHNHSHAAAAASDDSEGEEFNLERELENVMDGDGTPENLNFLPASNPHGGYLLQINDIIWCFHCGASASIGNTSLYLRRRCEGKPVNESMRRRRGRLIKRQHPTTAVHLPGSHKRVRIV